EIVAWDRAAQLENMRQAIVLAGDGVVRGDGVHARAEFGLPVIDDRIDHIAGHRQHGRSGRRLGWGGGGRLRGDRRRADRQAQRSDGADLVGEVSDVTGGEVVDAAELGVIVVGDVAIGGNSVTWPQCVYDPEVQYPVLYRRRGRHSLKDGVLRRWEAG